MLKISGVLFENNRIYSNWLSAACEASDNQLSAACEASDNPVVNSHFLKEFMKRSPIIRYSTGYCYLKFNLKFYLQITHRNFTVY